MAAQLGLLWDYSEGYSWRTGSTRDYHLMQIRQHTGWRFPTAQDKEELENWLRVIGARDAQTVDPLFDSACRRLRSLQLELPAESELQGISKRRFERLFSRYKSMDIRFACR